MARLGFDPTTYNKSVQEYTLGQRLDYAGREYVFIKMAEATTAGIPLEVGSTPWNCYKAGSGSATGRKCFGVPQGSISSGNYGFSLVRGYITNLVTDGNVVAGDFLKTGTATGVRDTSTLSIDFGYADAADAGTVGTAYIFCGV